MSLLNPEYLWLLLFLLVAFMKKDFRVLRFTSYGYITTFMLIVLALTRPVIEQEPVKTQELLNDVVIAIDLSYSMQAQDISPSRLKFAKTTLAELVKVEQKSRFGVLGFTTNAIILSPLTQDTQLLLHLFNMLDEKLIMTKGSSIMPALILARKMSKSPRVSVVIFTDGGDELNYEDEALYAKQNHLEVNILMIATQSGGTLRLANGDLLKDEMEDIVVSRENSAISIISQVSGGVYTHSLSEIISTLHSQRDSEYKSNVTVVQNVELFYYLVTLALIVFLVSVTTLKRYIVVLLLFLGVSVEADILDFIKNENRLAFDKGVSLYKAGEYEKALSSFRNVKSNKAEIKAVVYYNSANSLVRLKEYAKARIAYRKSLALQYTKVADENLKFIRGVAEEKQMTTGQQKSPKKSKLAKKNESTQKKKKEGGSSNMKVSAAASNGASEKAKKSKQETSISLNTGKAKLSSKQYELINKRKINEQKPW
ncbi:VWA domain-containing protein [Sulfurimonas sp. SAG-AH-194-L11]|nr:VWA domain-containing protein [Sulfurimonas sp. SAG-AH-194-L11]MDF1876445.1 VWA domain-containing protein [Sulfurimonas sp. SAG-AH-194-L11]